VSATVTPSERSTLRSDPAVSAVVPDQVIHLAPPAVTPGSSAGPGGNEFGSIQDAITNFPQGNQGASIPYAYTIK
jgi:hypothetical protein